MSVVEASIHRDKLIDVGLRKAKDESVTGCEKSGVEGQSRGMKLCLCRSPDSAFPKGNVRNLGVRLGGRSKVGHAVL